MLSRLLAEIRAEGTLNTGQLARRLEISEEMVKALIDDLKRRRLLTEIDLDCGPTCQGCPMAGSCVTNGKKGRVWQVGR
jgi:DNA-binding Lrp family transcriptional regulator